MTLPIKFAKMTEMCCQDIFHDDLSHLEEHCTDSN